ncbi:MAG TPA: adenylate/guanylate cyclase domain-containing protein [Solirubrobacteraceae bacterium]|nr:adenylate/guanylate cyclase domain-containing protein [Solirubrobacteraceae bacterium]
MITLLFTDIEGSTRMLDRLGERYGDVQHEHDRVMREAIRAVGGREVRTAGDSFFAVFDRASEAIECAVSAQRGFAAVSWPNGERLRVRMGIHTGAPALDGGDFLGMDVHRAARVAAVANGGQVLLSGDAARAAGRSVQLLDLGHHRLKDLPESEHLFQVLADGLERGFPRLRSLNRSNLPALSGELIGRRAEIERALALLERREVRVLTLLGPGGTGKTRLAVDVAGEAVGRYRDGVWMVALAAIPDRALMVSEVARVLEVDQAEGQTLEQSLADALSERELLLLLDNLEHLPEAGETVAALVAAAPGLDVLATSREALRLRGEQRLDVPPLPIAEAAELFLASAQAVRPDLVVYGEDREAVARICERLDGLPLAIELAAARTAIFGPRALEARLGQRLALSEGPRDLPERQRTLRATTDWSYRLLDPDERRLFEAMSAFVGGVRVDSAEAVWGDDAVECLIALTEKSLLRRRDDADGEPRFWMLETIREFARERAGAAGRSEQAAVRHAEYCLALAEEAEPQLIGPDQARWLDRLEDDHLNLRAALDYLTEQDPSKAVILAGDLTWFWTIRGYAPEARRRLGEVIAAAPDDAPGRGLAVYGASDMAVQLHDMGEARELLHKAVVLARAEGNQRLTSVALSHLAWTHELLGEHDKMHALHHEAIATAREAGDDWALGIALNNYAIAQSLRSDTSRHEYMLEQALEVVTPTRDLFMIALISNNLAEARLEHGDLESADSLSTEALELARQIKYRSVVSQALVVQSIVALHREDLERARTLLAEAIQASSPYAIEPSSLLLAGAGSFAAATQQPNLAAKLWGAAERARQRIGLEETPKYARLRESFQPLAALTDRTAWSDAWAAGAALSIDDALALADSATATINLPGSPLGSFE